ncbi:hypothetical protein Phi12:2_pg3 [Cellulophaga phage phi12:2]|uniref:Uncharacterized protein n=1 Tax=Cellulophaga phage phi12:2 TaxID=1327969 RepID=R9ZXM8_9VIRU|nr:hypothetical protein Phi12:2_pg3 [Cellulophaga phage phi12:2]AGO47280.1 hypothetical protein Phi12:2_pg3 [Cellulophaga phage phi12:2]
MRITNKQLADYIGVSERVVKKHRLYYIDCLQLKRNYLTVYDISRLDGVPVVVVARIMGFPNSIINKISEDIGR